MQLTPAGFPEGISGIAEEIDGAIQHAPQPGRQSIGVSLLITWLRYIALRHISVGLNASLSQLFFVR
jgi:hypothetical protein